MPDSIVPTAGVRRNNWTGSPGTCETSSQGTTIKPYVRLHMISSIDGKIDGKRWAGDGDGYQCFVKEYEAVHETLGPASWIVGRTTMQDFTSNPTVDLTNQTPLPRTTYNAAPENKTFAIVIDPNGKLTWDSDEVNGDKVIEVLSDRVSDGYLNHLRDVGVSYIFGGADSIDIPGVLRELKLVFGIDDLLVEGGGILNGSFLAAGVIDEISLLVAPMADGRTNGPVTFDFKEQALPATALELLGVEQRDGGLLRLRYRVIDQVIAVPLPLSA
jgi:2,5-diamino-6-(ribosylamino)-4(3H)-pyrimidinone 5'-phosphate reductase